MKYAYTTQKQVRAEFWERHPQASKRRTSDGDYVADTRVAFVEFVDYLERNGGISEALAQRVTL